MSKYLISAQNIKMFSFENIAANSCWHQPTRFYVIPKEVIRLNIDIETVFFCKTILLYYAFAFSIHFHCYCTH